jgi:ribosome-associated protein
LSRQAPVSTPWRRIPTDEARNHSILAARAAVAKNAIDTVVLDVGDIIGITDVFVITSGSNVRQVRTIAEETERQLKQEGVVPLQIEGLGDASWVLMDYGHFVVHVFLRDTRAYYGLERLWADAGRVEWEDAVAVS